MVIRREFLQVQRGLLFKWDQIRETTVWRFSAKVKTNADGKAFFGVSGQ
jgi:hypothetical protein